ncbi:MAG TPA: class I SAM-dependent methyltransferase [Chloroflexia bacterium]|nr:class I SAM-dependent methyltransferase [Chloroflexia bacterium]
MDGFSSTDEYLEWLWNHPVERQNRHLELRQAHTTYLTDQAEATDIWASARIASFLSKSFSFQAKPGLLDAGCGAGRYLALLSQKPAFEVQLAVGLDRNREALAEAQRTLRGRHEISLVQGNVRKLPFKAGSFGAAMCNRMLNQTGDIAAALSQVADVLVDGGLLFIVTADSELVSPLRVAHLAALQRLNFPEKLYRSSTPPDQRLNLQNGKAWLEPRFQFEALELYERRLSFTDPALLMEYYASGLLFQKSAGMAEPGINARRWATLYASIKEELAGLMAASGQLTFSDGAALFVASRKI